MYTFKGFIIIFNVNNFRSKFADVTYLVQKKPTHRNEKRLKYIQERVDELNKHQKLFLDLKVCHL